MLGSPGSGCFVPLTVCIALWHLFDFISDIIFYAISIQGEAFKTSQWSHDKVALAAGVLLGVNALVLITSQYYLCGAKMRAHRIRLGISRGEPSNSTSSKLKVNGKRKQEALRQKQAEHFDDLFEARLARTELWVMVIVFLLEDAPGLVFTIIVQTATGDFGLVEQIQFGSCLAGAFFFLIVAYRRCRKGREREQQRRSATRARSLRGLFTAIFSAAKSDVKSKQLTGPNVKKELVNAAKEPHRAKVEQRAYEHSQKEVARAFHGSGAAVSV